MFKGLSDLQWLNACAGIEVRMGEHGSYNYRYVELRRRRDQLQIRTKSSMAAEPGKLPGSWKARPVSICLTGSNIFIKKTATIQQLTNESVGELFPGLKADEFYFQNFTSGNASFVSIVRKADVDDILTSLTVAGFNILLVHIGPFTLDRILNQLSIYGPEFAFDGHTIQVDSNGEWQHCRFGSISEQSIVKVDSEPLESKYLLAYSIAFKLLLQETEDGISIKAINERLIQYQDKGKLAARATLIGILSILILLISKLALWRYDSDNQSLQAQISNNSASIADSRKAQLSIEYHKSLMDRLGYIPNVRYAYLLADLGKSIPSSIRLNNMEVNPLVAFRTNAGENTRIIARALVLEGSSDDVTAVSRWIDHLNVQAWVKKVQLNHFRPGEEGNEFKLSITF